MTAVEQAQHALTTAIASGASSHRTSLLLGALCTLRRGLEADAALQVKLDKITARDNAAAARRAR